MKKQLLNLTMLVLALLMGLPANAEDAMLSYCNGQVGAEGFGMGDALSVSAASYFPESATAPFIGGKLTKVRCYMCTTQNVKTLKLWVKRKVADRSYVANVTVTNLAEGWNEVTLPTPLEIQAGDTFVLGMTYTQLGTAYPISLGTTYHSDGLYIGSASSMMDYSADYPTLCIEGQIEDITVEGNKMQITALNAGSNNYSCDSDIDLNMEVVNCGEHVTSFGVDVSVNGGEAVHTDVECNLNFNEVQYVALTAKAPSTAMSDCTIAATITSINGVDVAEANQSTMSTTVNVMKTVYSRNVVIEEGTGTWCGWCVRGIVAMEYMAEKYPDSFIGIAVHNGDGMAVSSYPANVSGFPSCNVDRTIKDAGVSNEDFEAYYLQERREGSIANIEFEAKIVDNKIVASTVTTFGLDCENTDYRMVYALKENGVTGYSQQNNYAGGSYGPMGGFESRPSVVRDLAFNDVARSIYPSFAGVTGGYPSSIVAEQEYTNSVEYNVPSNVKDRSQLTLVAMLLDGNTDRIIQAQKVALQEESGVAANEIAPATEEARYTIDGRLITEPERGINIVRMSDGSVRKVVVR